MKYLKSYNESVRDFLKPKSSEDIIKHMMYMLPKDIMLTSIEKGTLDGVKYAIEAFFVEVQSGITFATQKYNDEAGYTYFAYAPGVGCTIAFGVEAGVRFEGWLIGESVLN